MGEVGRSMRLGVSGPPWLSKEGDWGQVCRATGVEARKTGPGTERSDGGHCKRHLTLSQ